MHKSKCYDLNGLLLCDIYIPEEVILKILSYVRWKDLLSCRLVCCLWKKLISALVCYTKLNRESKKLLNASFTCSDVKLNYPSIPFYLYLAIGKNIFGRNLLKNVFGEEGFKYWNVTHNRSLGNRGWIVEQHPIGCDPLPEELGGTSCFTTTFYICLKKQRIHLKNFGFNSKVMDEIQPHISISEWFAARVDCGSSYRLKVSLLDEKKAPIIVYEDKREVEQWQDGKWNKVSHTFTDYGPGVRHIVFEHAGHDNQGWAGQYGSKMAGGTVIIQIPSSLFTLSSN